MYKIKPFQQNLLTKAKERGPNVWGFAKHQMSGGRQKQGSTQTLSQNLILICLN